MGKGMQFNGNIGKYSMEVKTARRQTLCRISSGELKIGQRQRGARSIASRTVSLVEHRRLGACFGIVKERRGETSPLTDEPLDSVMKQTREKS